MSREFAFLACLFLAALLVIVGVLMIFGGGAAVVTGGVCVGVLGFIAFGEAPQ